MARCKIIMAKWQCLNHCNSTYILKRPHLKQQPDTSTEIVQNSRFHVTEYTHRNCSDQLDKYSRVYSVNTVNSCCNTSLMRWLYCLKLPCNLRRGTLRLPCWRHLTVRQAVKDSLSAHTLCSVWKQLTRLITALNYSFHSQSYTLH